MMSNWRDERQSMREMAYIHSEKKNDAAKQDVPSFILRVLEQAMETLE
jgi:hypothetical protein